MYINDASVCNLYLNYAFFLSVCNLYVLTMPFSALILINDSELYIVMFVIYMS